MGRTLLTWVVLLAAIYFFLVNSIGFEISVFFRPDQHITGVFNSNQLFLAYLYQNLFIHHGSWKSWTFSPVPYFFPDGAIFFILATLLKNIQLAVLLSNGVCLVLYYVLLVAVGQLVCAEKSKNLFRLSALFSLFLGSGPLAAQEIFVPLWSSHFGSTVLMYLLGMFLILKSWKEEKKRYYALMTVLVFLTSLSDPYFFLLFFGSVFFGRVRKPFFFKMLWLIFLAGLAGVFINFFDLLHFHGSLLSLNTLQQIFTLFFKNNPCIFLLSLIFLILGIKLFFKPNQNDQSKFIFVSVAFSILIAGLASLLLDADLLKPHFLSLRHFQTAILLPSFLCLPILLAQYAKITKFVNQYYLYLLIAITALLLLFRPYQSIATMPELYPPVTQCLDAYAEQSELGSKNGVAQYWDAHVNDVLSKEGLNIVAMNKFLKPYDWMSTRNDYLNKKFNFVLVQKNLPLAEYSIKKWGKPDKILTCPEDSRYLIYIYQQGFSI